MNSRPETACDEEALVSAMQDAAVAYAYFDASDHLQFWNTAYEDLNFCIKDLIVPGASFPILLSALIVRGQIKIDDGLHGAWIKERLRARRFGATAFRNLSDGRTFLVQERRDAVGGTLGFWTDVTDLFAQNKLTPIETEIRGASGDLSDPGYQDLLRTKMQTIIGNLEIMRFGASGPDQCNLIDDGLNAARFITQTLDVSRRAPNAADVADSPRMEA